MKTSAEMVFVGIHGFVLALDRATGAEIWRVELIGSDFVNLTLDGDQLLATAKGEIFCLEINTGVERWRNKLTGMGRGMLSIVTANSPTASTNLSAEMELRQRQAAEAAVIASSVS